MDETPDKPTEPVPPVVEDRQPVDAPDNIRPFKVVAKGTKAEPPKPPAQPAPPQTLPAKLTKQQRKDMVYRAHLQGVSFRELAKELGISWSQVKRDYDEVAAVVTLEGHAQAKQLLWERMELATRALMPKVIAGNVAAIHELTVISERQARMIGVDAPMKVAATTPDGNQWAPLVFTLDRLTVEQLKVLREANDIKILPPVKDAEVVNE